METTKYTKLYAVPVERIGEITWYEGTAEWGEGSPKLSEHAGFDLSSVSVSLALGYDSSCEINVIGARDTDNNSKAVAIQDADSLYMETLMREFRYGRRFNVYQAIGENTPDMLLFSGFVFSAGSGVSSSAQSLELGFKVTLASAAKLYDNSYIKNPGYYFVRSSNDTKYGPTRLSTLIPRVAEWKSTATVPETVNTILQKQELIKGPTDIARIYQQLIDFFMQGDRNATTSRNPHKIAEMFDIGSAYQLNAKINTQATAAAPNNQQQTIHPVLRNSIISRVIQHLPGNSAVAVFCHALSEFYLTVAPRVSTELEKNMVIIPSSGFGTYTNELTNSDVIGYTRYEAQRAPNSLVNIWVYGNTTLSTQSGTTSSNWPLVALNGWYDDKGQLKVELIDNPLIKSKGTVTKNKDVTLGPIQTVQMPMWGLQGTGTDAKTGENTLTAQQKKLAAALATTMFASGGMVADNISMTISYDALEKVINGVGCVYKLDTLLPGGQIGGILQRSLNRAVNSVLSRHVCYGRLKQLSFQFSCNGTNLNTQVQCTFDSVLREPEYQSLVVKGSLRPENMLLIPKKDTSKKNEK
jgi:hypothetical protein